MSTVVCRICRVDFQSSAHSSAWLKIHYRLKDGFVVARVYRGETKARASRQEGKCRSKVNSRLFCCGEQRFLEVSRLKERQGKRESLGRDVDRYQDCQPLSLSQGFLSQRALGRRDRAA